MPCDGEAATRRFGTRAEDGNKNEGRGEAGTENGDGDSSAGETGGRATFSLSPGIVLLFAIACGASVANVYFSQP
ncbi:hypothetical protein GT038_30090, partial [Streptomyces sp. SID337]|nr:hypothetical protein [Streptomyces sp. SID337]